MKPAAAALLCLALANILATPAAAVAHTFTADESETLRNVLLTGSGTLVVGSNTTLRRLSPELAELQAVSLPDDEVNRLLIGDPGGTFSDRILSCVGMSCALLDIDDITNQSWEASNVLLLGNLTAHGLFVSGREGESILTVALQNEQRPSFIIRGRLVGVGSTEQLFDGLARQAEEDNLVPREFLTVFKNEDFSYYLHKLTVGTSTDQNVETRLVRICNNDTGSSVSANAFSSHFELRLECGGSGTIPTAATFLSSHKAIALSVTRASESENSVCVFELAEIQRLMTEKYNNCTAGIGNSGLARDNTAQCIQFSPERLNNPNINECNLVSDLLLAQEVPSPLSRQTVFSLPLSSGQFTSLIHSSLDDVQFLFAGTNNGKVYQYRYDNNASVSFVRTITLVNGEEVVGANITQLTVTTDGLTLYALSSKRLFSLDVDVCDSFTSCNACLGEGRYPVCGWCSLENRCSRQSQCSTGSPEWVSDGMGSCPVITSADPSIVYVRELQTANTEIELTTDNIPDDHTYQCWFDIHTSSAEQHAPSTAVTMEISAERNGDMFTCTVPSNSVPEIPKNEDALLAELSLRNSGNDVAVLNEPIRFANCSVHTNCTSCVTSDSRCNWCPFTFKCIASRGEACPEVTETAVMESCPRLRPPENTDNYLVHVDHTYGESPLVITAENLGQFSESFSDGEFRCVVRAGADQLFATSAILNSEKNVECARNRFDYAFADGVARLETTLAVEWIRNSVTIDNPNRTGVTFYSCGRLGSNCAQCLSLDNHYRCTFCQSQFSCLLDDRCTGDIIDTVEDCPLPSIDSVSPSSGPIDGGTMVTVTGRNLATRRSEIDNVTIAGSPCNIIDHTYQPGVSFQCVTGAVEGRGSRPIRIEFRYLAQPRQGSSFTYETPSLSKLMPTMGPKAGGTTVTITGSHLDIGSSIHVTMAGQNCYKTSVDEDEVVCISGSSDVVRTGNVTVTIDNWSRDVSGTLYEYTDNPTVMKISPDFSFIAGGTEYVVLGENFNVIREPRLLVHIMAAAAGAGRRRRQGVQVITSQPCVTEAGGTRMTCQAPPIDSALITRSAMLGLQLDGVDSLRILDNYTVTLHPNPTFQNFGSHSFSNTETIRLTVDSEDAKFEFTPEMVLVLITPCSRKECECGEVLFRPGNKSLSCVVESTSGLSRGSDLTVRVHVGHYNQSVGRIRISKPVDPVVIIIPIVVAFLIIVMVVVVILLVVCYRARQKDSRYKELIVEMEKLESSVARECKLGFAELQTDLDELTGDISGHRLPYHDLKVYLLSSLFPGSKDHPVLHPVQLPVQRQISSQRAIKDFYDLCMDKKVLLLFIRTLEEQRSFTIRDKSLVGSLLMIALHSRLDYATEILKMLMSDLITKAISKSSPKLLLRRTESVAEKMLTNWLAFCLHGYIVEQAGKPLYLLYRAVKSQLEKGPIDVITGEARYSLSEHKLIRQKMDVEVLLVTVEADDGLRVPVKVLSCDTISQVKEKLLDVIYKATPVSQRPALTSIDLEYIKSHRDYLILRDEDTSMVTEGDWKRLNTLQHYGVKDGATFRLMKRKGSAPPGRTFDYPASLISSHAVRNRSLSEADDGSRVWHLFKQHDVEDPKRSPFMNKKMITEVYLPRMLSTKNILQKFVDDLFTSLFSVTTSPTSPISYTNFFPTGPGMQAPMSYAPGSTVPMAIKYLLDFLDDAAESAQVSERDVVHTWKNNALTLRFWVNMMKNPEFVFDVNKSHTVDACLSVIAGAFIDGCSYADVKLTIDSPTSKLLYNKEVQGYKTKVRQYYQSVARLPRIPEDAMQSYLKQISEHQAQVFRKAGGFVIESALYELLRYGNRYSEHFLTNLRDAGLEARAQVFESIVRATM